MFASALLTGGIGPWLGYQIFAAAWIGLLAGSLPKKLRGFKEILLLICFGIFASGFFGVLMDLQFWPWALGSNTQLSYLPNGNLSENLSRFITFHFATAMAWDVPRAIFTSALIAFTGGAVLSALRRTHTRAAFVAPIIFNDFNERVKQQREVLQPRIVNRVHAHQSQEFVRFQYLISKALDQYQSLSLARKYR